MGHLQAGEGEVRRANSISGLAWAEGLVGIWGSLPEARYSESFKISQQCGEEALRPTQKSWEF